MTNHKLEQVIEKAIEGGWDSDGFIGEDYFPNGYCDVSVVIWSFTVSLQRTRKDGTGGRWVAIGNLNEFFLDPDFWEALGKTERWASQYADDGGEYEGWLANWHSFLDHLADGKDPESFFKELLT